MADNNLEEFKKLVRKAIFLKRGEESLFVKIPDEKWESIFKHNFDGNFEYASRVLLNKFSEIEKIDTEKVDRYKLKIFNYDRSLKMMNDAIDTGEKIIFLTDIDNDGSLSQAVINEYVKIDKNAAKNMHIEYAQPVGDAPVRGFSLALVEQIAEAKGISDDESFLIITADNGINSLEEQKKLQAKYPNIKILVTDHHNPEPGMVIEENANVVIFNPKYKPTENFEKFNISGAMTICTLLKGMLEARMTPVELEPFRQNRRNMNKIAKVSNVLDYVETHPADKPEKDYVVSRFLELQPLMNINNSITKMITGEISSKALDSIRIKIPKLDVDALQKEVHNIRTQNSIAKILLKIYTATKDTPDIAEEKFNEMFLAELVDKNNYVENSVGDKDIDPNYIGKMRPVIFNLTADDEKTAFFERLNERMINTFGAVKMSEKRISEALRAGEVITKEKLPNSTIAYADANILGFFNRKLLNKIYNDENPGFALTLDSKSPERMSGSFRSLYDIRDILKDKATLEKNLNIKIETPGHERAAGFIIKSIDAVKYPVTEKTIEEINKFINASIDGIKVAAVANPTPWFLTDLQSIPFVDRINHVVRGNIANFDRVMPILKITKDTIWTDSYTTEQYSMKDIVDKRKYGYISININFHGDTVIVPVELVRNIVEHNYEGYLSLNYMDGGVFMAERVVPEKDIIKLIDLREKDGKTEKIRQAFEKDFADTNVINLTRKQLIDNPFFKYSDDGVQDFAMFEEMVIKIIETNKIDTLAVFDVEANGFGNARLMNFGATNYSIDENSGERLPTAEFSKRFYRAATMEGFLLSDTEIAELKEITDDERSAIPMERQGHILTRHMDGVYRHFICPAEKLLKVRNKYKLPYHQVTNQIVDDNGSTVFNRSIKANMLAYLVKDGDFKCGQEIINLTGINQELLDAVGKTTGTVDKELANFYKDKKVLFGAHNTPYDAKILRANMPKTYELLSKSFIYDSALFSRKQKLAYDFTVGAYFKGVPGISDKIYFYHNENSDFNLKKLLKNKVNGYYPDRSGRYLFEVKDGEYFLVDKEKHDKIKIQSKVSKLLDSPELKNIFIETPKGFVLSAKNGLIKEDLNEFQSTKKNQNFLEKNFPNGISAVYSLPGNENVQIFEQQGLYTVMKVDATVKPKVTTLYPVLPFLEELESKLIIEEFPDTAVKYSVEKLSEQWMVHALLLSDEKFKISYVPIVAGGQFECFLDRKQDLKFLQDNYHFDTDIANNIKNFDDNYQLKNGKEFLEKEGEQEKLQEFMEQFLERNKTIQAKFSDAWMFKRVLEIKDPTRKEVTKDLVDLVNYQTSIPVGKIQDIFDKAIKFKEKYKVSHILQHEQHVNGLWEGDVKGDVLFEDKLTLGLLGRRMYDAYSHDIDKAVDRFNQYQLDARKAFDIADHLADEAANDSYSFRQALLYNRADDETSDLVKALQKKEAEAGRSDAEATIKFKLPAGILNQDTAIYGITRKGVTVSREEIKSDSEKLAFIMLNKQVDGSIGLTGDASVQLCVKNILDANQLLVIQHKQDLSSRYRYIEFNKKDFNTKKIIEIMVDALNGVYSVEEKVSPSGVISFDLYTPGTDKKPPQLKSIPIEDVDKDGLQIVHNVLKSYIDNHARLFDARFEQEDNLMLMLKDWVGGLVPSNLESAFTAKAIAFNDFSQTSEPGFLNRVETNKQKPLELLLHRHGEMNLLTQVVEQGREAMAYKSPKKKKSP